MKPNSLEVDASLIGTVSQSATPPLYLKIEQYSELNALSKELMAAVGGYIVDVRVSDSASTRAEKLDLVRRLHGTGQPVRALCYCDLSASGSSAVISTGGVIGDLVDSGAKSVILHSHTEPIDLDVSREVLEEALYLDCSGDPIRQRLGVHVTFRGRGDEEVLKQAAELGVMHFSAAAGHMPRVLGIVRRQEQEQGQGQGQGQRGE